MNLRSQGSSNLIPIVDNIQRIGRDQSRERRERERREHIRRLDMEGDQHNPPLQDPPQEDLQGRRIEEQARGVGMNNQQPNQRRIGAFDEPNVRRTSTGIRPPAVRPNNFEIKHSLINMIQGSKFYGLPNENPLDHLDDFDRLCRTVKINGVSEEAIKMILFPFSLGDKAAQWEKNIPSELVSTWANVEKEFMGKFFSKQKTAKIRNDITSFKQRGNESFYEAWERLKGYTRSCPHHGVAKDALLGIFHRGVLEKYRTALDTASRGSFANLSVDEGEALIESLAQSDQTYGGDYDRSYSGSRDEDPRFKELNDRIDKLSRMNLKGVNFVGETDGTKEVSNEEDQERQEDLCYVQEGFYPRSYNPNFKPYNNLSYRNPNVENPQDQQYPPFKPQQQPYVKRTLEGQSSFQPKPQFNQYQGQGSSSTQIPKEDDNKFMLKQILEGQTRGALDLSKKILEVNNKIDGAYKGLSELNTKFDALSTHVKGLDNQVAQIASSSKSNGKGILPGKPEANPKDFCGMIFGIEEDDNEKSIRELEALLGCTVDNDGVITYGEDMTPKESLKESTCEELLVVNLHKGEYEESPFDGVCVDEPLAIPRGRIEESNVPPQWHVRKQLQWYFENQRTRPNTISPTLRQLAKTDPKLHARIAEFEKKRRHLEVMGKELGIIPHEDGMRYLEKKQSPGKFMVPCMIKGMYEENALVDTGASVNVISYDMVKKWGIKEPIKPTSPIALADNSIKRPLGRLDSYPIRIEDCIIPTDFVVVEMSGPEKFALLLGTPFMDSVGAVIDFVRKEVVLTYINPNRYYKMIGDHEGYCSTLTWGVGEENEGIEKELNSLQEELEYLQDREAKGKDVCLEEFNMFEELKRLFGCDKLEESSKDVEGEKKPSKPCRNKGKKKKPQLVVDNKLIFTTHALEDDYGEEEKDYIRKTPCGEEIKPSMMLVPIDFDCGVIEYKVKCKGMPKPFARAKSTLPQWVIDKGLKFQFEMAFRVIYLDVIEKKSKNAGGVFSNRH